MALWIEVAVSDLDILVKAETGHGEIIPPMRYNKPP